ncbi:MAG: J domain-containing protein [Steroidobacteraceae bacterium]
MFRYVVIAVCFVLGYLVVSRLIRPSSSLDSGSEPERATMSNWFTILGVRENANHEEIKAAYRRLIAQVHPDKVGHLSDAERARAEARAKQINAAYELGSKLFES